MKRKKGKPVILILISVAALACPTIASALIMVSEGNDPVNNRGWPTGSEEVANYPARLRFKEGPPFGGGEYHFEYQCKSTDDFNKALQLFGKIRAPRQSIRSMVSLSGERTEQLGDKALLLVIHDGPPPGYGGRNDSGPPVIWTFTVWVPENYYRLYSSPSPIMMDHPNYRQPVPAPRIDAYVDGESPVVWKDVRVPDSVLVMDERANSAPVDTSAGGVMRGGVFDMMTHQVIGGAEVVVRKRVERGAYEEVATGKTDESGRFVITGIPQGYHEILIRADGYAARNVGPFDNRGGHAFREFDTLLVEPAPLTGLVLDAQGRGILGAEVTARDMVGIDGFGYSCPGPPAAKTDKNGRFVLTGVPQGSTYLKCKYDAYYQRDSLSKTYRVSTRQWEQEEDIRITMVGTGVVQVKVVGPDGKPPTRQFNVEIEDARGSKPGLWGGSANLKDDGTFEFKGVPPADYRITVRPNPSTEGEESEPQTVTVVPGKTVELSFTNEYAHERKRRQ